MAKYVIMPKLGFNMQEGKIVKWLKKEGESIEEQEAILQIETDKSVIDVESQVSGILRKIIVSEGEVVPVTLPIAIIAEEDEDIDGMVQEAMKKLGSNGKENNLQKKAKAERTLEEDVPLKEFDTGLLKSQDKKISPRARKKAQQLGIDLSAINHYFSKEIIVEKDILEISKKENMTQSSMREWEKTGNEKTILKEEPYSGMRQIIGKRLSESKFSAPHIYFSSSVDMSNSLNLINDIKQNREEDISINDLIIFVVVQSLIEQPKLNTSLVDDKIVYFSDINIGIAVGLEEGLIVPVLKKAHRKSLIEISKETKKLIVLARDRKLLPEDYQSGTFTVSNLGMFGIEEFTAIINPPESGILAIGSIQKKPVVDDFGQIVIRPMLKLTLSVDHRIIDGITAAYFLNIIKKYLSNPGMLLLKSR